MSVAIGAHMQRLVPQRFLCRCIYRLARSRRYWIKAPLIAWFHRHYRVDMSEADPSRPQDYATFNAFFTRPLKAGARAVASGPRSIVAPSDGTLTEFGTLERDRMLQAKGVSYSLPALLGVDPASAAPFIDGDYATVYLAPHDYHRVHAPATGRLVRTRYVPGARFSVSPATTCTIADLFCRNERVVCWFDCDFGPLVVVLVGALNVSSISTTTRGEIASGAAREWREREPVVFAKGAEVGRFNLGSTVVMVLPRGAIRWRSGLARGDTLLMGAEIATTPADRGTQ